MTSFLAKLNLNENTKNATIKTKLNGNSLEWDTRTKEVGTGHWKLGHEIEKTQDGTYIWKTWTVEDGKHVLNFHARLSKEGTLDTGMLNAFWFGFIPLDQDYLDELLHEYKDSPPKWETVSL